MIQSRLFGDLDLVHQWMRGALDAEAVVARLVSDTKYDRHEWLEELESSCGQMRLVDESLWQMVPQIRALGVTVAIATDNMDTFPRWTVPALGLTAFVDDILDSWTRGALKSDVSSDGRSAFFAPWLEARGIDPAEAVLFDDGTLGGQRFGIRVVAVSETKPLARSLAAYLP